MAEKLKIIFEDEQILVVDKPAGLVVNRSTTIDEETLQDQLAKYFKLGSDLGIGDRAGIVHRLDRETSGLLVVAKTEAAFENLQRQFKERKVKKEYIALVHGRVRDQSGSIIGDIARIGRFGKFGMVEQGRESRTDFKVRGYYQFDKGYFDVLMDQNRLTRSRVNYLKHHAQDYTLLDLYPKTGRTHQVRVHLKSIGHPVVSDLIYTPKKLLKFDLLWCPRLFLHASRIEFEMPPTKRIKFAKNVVFEVSLPYDLVKACDYLKKLPNG